MKRLIFFTTFILSVLLLNQSSAFAYQDFHNRFKDKQERQMQRIKQGFRQDQFTFHELKQLIIKQNQLEQLSRRYGKNNHYSHREKQELRKKLKRLNKMIKRMRHNDDLYYSKQDKRYRKWSLHSS